MDMPMNLENRFDPVERGDVAALRDLQFDRMRWSLTHAYNTVPHYRQSFDAAGVHPYDLRTLDDLKHFPFTVKNDLRDNYPFGMIATPMRDVVRVHASSGTTGKPTVVAYTQNDIDVWSSVMALSLIPL